MLALLLAPELARAGDRLDEAVAGRPLTIGRANVMVGIEPGLVHTTDTGFTATLPLRVGLSDNFELFADPVLQTFSPALEVDSLGGMYRFVHTTPLEIGLRVASNLELFQPVQGAEFQIGVPFRLHLGGRVAVDFGAHLLLPVAPEASVGALFPFGLTVNPTDHVFVDVASAVRIPDLTEADATLATPGNVEIGYTFARNNPNLDLGARSTWEDLQTLDAVAISAFARVYFYP
jgi:hypothetical protein